MIAVKISGLASWLCEKASKDFCIRGVVKDRAYQANLGRLVFISRTFDSATPLSRQTCSPRSTRG